LKALTKKLHFWCAGTSEYAGHGRVPRLWGQGQGHTSVTKLSKI